MPTRTIIEAIRASLHEAMARDERVFVLGEDVGANGGVFKATEGLYDRFGEHRVIDTPLAESAIAGVAVGAALNGMRPVAEIQFADFIHPALNQIVNEAAKMRYRSNGVWGVPLVIRAPYGAGIHGGMYHSQSVEAWFCHVPGLKVVAPATPYDAKGLLAAAIADPDPVLVFEHKKTYRSIRGDVPDTPYTVPIGKAERRTRGEHLTVVSYGLALHQSLAAAEQVIKDGHSIEVIDLRTLFPLDVDLILSSVKQTGKVLIVHEDTLTGGIGGEVAALIGQHAFEWLDGPITRLAPPDIPAAPYAPPLEEAFMLNADKIAAAMRELLAY